jgi:hypothetical protein
MMSTKSGLELLPTNVLWLVMSIHRLTPPINTPTLPLAEGVKKVRFSTYSAPKFILEE